MGKTIYLILSITRRDKVGGHHSINNLLCAVAPKAIYTLFVEFGVIV